MAHSKRNTSLAFFTHYERQLLRHTWGAQSTRLTRDSFLPFGSCRLCLMPARDPVACTTNVSAKSTGGEKEGKESSGTRRGKADLFCRECALNDLVMQRREIKRMEDEMERRKEEGEEEKREREAEERRKEIEGFERTMAGFDDDGRGSAAVNRGVKRKAEEMHGRRSEEASRGRENSDHHHALPTSPTLKDKTEASFWVPGVDVANQNHLDKPPTKPIKLHPLCPASTPSTKHTYSLKTLISVHFTRETEQNEEGGQRRPQKSSSASSSTNPPPICPSCRKSLNNSSRATLTQPCGHVICGNCVDRFMISASTLNPDPGPSSSNPTTHRQNQSSSSSSSSSSTTTTRPTILCYVCETDLTTPAEEDSERIGGHRRGQKSSTVRGLMEISCEGTGFAGAGEGKSNLARKDGVAFQC